MAKLELQMVLVSPLMNALRPAMVSLELAHLSSVFALASRHLMSMLSATNLVVRVPHLLQEQGMIQPPS